MESDITMEHNSYEAAERLADAVQDLPGMASSIASGGSDEGTFRLVLKGAAYTVVVRPLVYNEAPVESMGAASAADFLAEMDAERRGREAAAYERGYRQSVIGQSNAR